MFHKSEFLSNLKNVIRRITFKNSKNYWIKRYKKGANSGSGSYGHLAEFKGKIINNFLKEKSVLNVIEFGCGDGNQLKYFNIPSYLGFDISPKAISICKDIFKGDKGKNFKLIEEYQNEQAELVISLDVIFHLIEDHVYEQYMNQLFSASQKYVIIYSSNSNVNFNINAPHFKNRAFFELIKEKFPLFELIKVVPNQYPYDGTENTSVSDFYIFSKTCSF